MNDKKNIDRLFQERFKDFESEPNEQAYEHSIGFKKKDKDKTHSFWIKRPVLRPFLLGVFVYTTTTNDMQKNVVIETKVIKIRSIEGFCYCSKKRAQCFRNK
jgi:hypothetical protein